MICHQGPWCIGFCRQQAPLCEATLPETGSSLLSRQGGTPGGCICLMRAQGPAASRPQGCWWLLIHEVCLHAVRFVCCLSSVSAFCFLFMLLYLHLGSW